MIFTQDRMGRLKATQTERKSKGKSTGHSNTYKKLSSVHRLKTTKHAQNSIKSNKYQRCLKRPKHGPSKLLKEP